MANALPDLRSDYRGRALDERAVDANPFIEFQHWLDEAIAQSLPEPNAMALATATRDGKPSARMVLLRGVDERGFIFFTNYNSRKGHDLAINPHVALVF